jgi:hypothetical protein
MIAATGTATRSPTKPKSAPKADSAKISQTGWSPTEEPTRFGVRMLPSTNWPAWKIAATASDPPPVAPELVEREPDGQRPADQRADVGNEGQRARDEAHDEPELSPTSASAAA